MNRNNAGISWTRLWLAVGDKSESERLFSTWCPNITSSSGLRKCIVVFSPSRNTEIKKGSGSPAPYRNKKRILFLQAYQRSTTYYAPNIRREKEEKKTENNKMARVPTIQRHVGIDEHFPQWRYPPVGFRHCILVSHIAPLRISSGI
jgi:hypothetical protein